METLWKDVRLAARSLRRAPAFTAAAVLTLGVAIGANSAIFSIVDQLLLRPLPYPNGEELVRIYETEGGPGFDVSPANWLDWQQQSRTVKSFAAWQTGTATLTGAGEAARLRVQVVSAEFFPVLGVRPLLGRTISPDDDRPNAAPVVVISHGLWERRFGGDPEVVGRSILLDEQPAEVVGVMPRDFRFIFHDTEAWMPLGLDRSRPWRDDAGRFIWIVARLQPGVGVQTADAEMRTIARRLADTHEFNRGTSVELVPLREELVGGMRGALLALYGGVVVLLSIACFNVANLLLARSTSRRHEVAIRLSLGARRATIIRQSLVETALLALGGGAVGLFIARWSVDTLLALTPAELMPLAPPRLDGPLLFYALALAGITALVGLTPALAATHGPAATHLRTNSRSFTHAPRLRQLLVAGQIAMTVVLLCGAGLLIRTVMALGRTDAGVTREGVLTMEVNLPEARYTDGRPVEFFYAARERVQGLPGVTSVAAAYSLPVTGGVFSGTGFHVRGTPVLPNHEQPSTAVRVVSPDYFRTLGIPVRRGREFTDADQIANVEPTVVVNEAFASRFLDGVDPLNAFVSVDVNPEGNPYARIVGVVGDVREGSLRDRARPTVFVNHGQFPIDDFIFFVRAAGPAALTRSVPAAISTLDSSAAVANVRTMDTVLGDSIARERLTALVSSSFAVTGLLLASIGVYGLLAFIVGERVKEIGIRVSLGATPTALVAGVVGGGLRLVLYGAVAGVVGAAIVSRWLGALLFGVTGYDPWTYGAVVALLLVVAAAATLVPARRAARIDPVVALRAE